MIFSSTPLTPFHNYNLHFIIIHNSSTSKLITHCVSDNSHSSSSSHNYLPPWVHYLPLMSLFILGYFFSVLILLPYVLGRPWNKILIFLTTPPIQLFYTLYFKLPFTFPLLKNLDLNEAHIPYFNRLPETDTKCHTVESCL